MLVYYNDPINIWLDKDDYYFILFKKGLFTDPQSFEILKTDFFELSAVHTGKDKDLLGFILKTKEEIFFGDDKTLGLDLKPINFKKQDLKIYNVKKYNTNIKIVRNESCFLFISKGL